VWGLLWRGWRKRSQSTRGERRGGKGAVDGLNVDHGLLQGVVGQGILQRK
jgi:hypothetical protein